MAKIPFTLEAWLKDKSQKVETGVGELVRILCTNAKGVLPIIGNVGENSENLQRWTERGQYHVGINTPDKDLFIITHEPELNEFEKVVAKYRPQSDTKETIQRIASELLACARKEALKDLQENLANNDIYRVPEWLREVLVMAKENGKKEALKDLPRWKKKENGFGYYCSCGFLVSDGYEISIAELKRKLPGFKENKSHE